MKSFWWTIANFQTFWKKISDLPLCGFDRPLSDYWDDLDKRFFLQMKKTIFWKKVSDFFYNNFQGSSLTVQPVWANDCLFREKHVLRKKKSQISFTIISLTHLWLFSLSGQAILCFEKKNVFKQKSLNFVKIISLTL